MFKKINYFVMKAYKDMFFPLIYSINKNNTDIKLEKYYFDFNVDVLLRGGSYEFNFDKNGIPLVKGHLSDTNGEYFYQPQAIGQYGLALYHKYIDTNHINYLHDFINIANWFYNNYKVNKEIPYWESTVKQNHNVYGGNDEVQLISSMSQSRAISILLRAFQETGEEKYMNLVEKALQGYIKAPSEGGFLDRNKNEQIFFEEVNQPRILNHLVFSLFGLYDYCRVKKFKTSYYDVFQQGIEAIKDELVNYDIGWWSLYDNYYINGKRRMNPCTRHYHNIHIQQMKVLKDITEEQLFEYYYKKWLKYDSSIYNRFKMIFNKMITVRQMGRI